MGNKGRSAIAKKIAQRHAESGYTEIQSAYLTKGDGTGTLLVNPGVDRRVWLHRKTDTGAIRDQIIAQYPVTVMIAPLRDGNVDLERQKVRIGKPPGIDEFFIIDANDLDGISSSGGMTEMERYINEGWWSGPQQITLFRPRPTDTPSTSILIDVFVSLLQSSTNTLYPITTLTVPLQLYISALASGEHQMVLPYVDKRTLGVGVLAQTAVASSATVGSDDSHNEFTESTVQLFSGITGDMQLTVPLEIYYQQAAITEAAFYRAFDARWAGLSSGAGGTALDVIINDNGLPVTNDNGFFVLKG
jgi:hypothetical protein